MSTYTAANAPLRSHRRSAHGRLRRFLAHAEVIYAAAATRITARPGVQRAFAKAAGTVRAGMLYAAVGAGVIAAVTVLQASGVLD